MVTIQNLVIYETFGAYAVSDVTNAITRAYHKLSPLVDEDNDLSISVGTVGNSNLELTNTNEADAVASLAVAILVNARQHIKGKSQDITPISIDQMITEEMRQMLLIGDPVDPNTVDSNFYNANPSHNAYGETN